MIFSVAKLWLASNGIAYNNKQKQPIMVCWAHYGLMHITTQHVNYWITKHVAWNPKMHFFMKEMSFWYSNMVQTTMVKKRGNVHWDIMMQAVVFQTYKYVSCVVCIALFCHLSPLLCSSVNAFALWSTNLRQIKMSMCSEGKNIFLASSCKLNGFFFFFLVKSGIKKTQAMCQYRQTVSPTD